MALDVESVAVLAANILYLYRKVEDKSPKNRPAFWTPEAMREAESMGKLLNAEVTSHDTPDSVEFGVQEQLETDAMLCQDLETKYPRIAFAQLIQVLADDLAAESADPKLSEKAEVAAVLEKVRLLIGEEGYTAEASVIPGGDIDAQVAQAVLFFDDRLAAQTAIAFERGLPFLWTLRLELEAVSASRKLRNVSPEDATKRDEAQLVGLAFSGGGIRSATLNLGILQALAEAKLFHYFDYLSTVSGGGYIGSWLHAWIRREKKPDNVPSALSPHGSPDPESVATHPIKWLRQYSNYLAPQKGLMSVDSWSIAAIWARNTLLNLIVIVMALSAVLMVPRGVMVLFDLVQSGSRWALIGLVPLAAAIFMIQRNLRSFGKTRKYMRKDQFLFQQGGIHVVVALPIFLSAILVAAWLFEVRGVRSALRLTDALVAGFFFVLLCYVSFLGGYRQSFYEANTRPQSGRPWIRFALAVLFFNGICAAVGGLLLLGVGRLFELWSVDGAKWHALVWGPFAITVVYSVVIILHLGLFGRNLPDDRREWWSRAGAVLSLWLLAWMAVAGTAVYGAWIVAALMNYPLGHYLGVLLGSGWFGTTLAGVLAARGDKTGPSGSDPVSDLVARIAPPVFIAGLLLLVSFALQIGAVALMGFGFPGMERMEAEHFAFLSWWTPLDAWMAAAVCMGIALLLSSRVDVNQFSMHNFYENRLVRCYLGASRRDRQPNRFTGFDPDDDLALASLTPSASKDSYLGPYPIFNATLNLVSGEELAWQERKAESFSFTPLFSGFAALPTEERGGVRQRKGVSLYSYRPTPDYAFPNGGIRVGRVVAISGAALSPNWGFHTAPATAFLLTIFNVRLGAWIGNPRDMKTWTRSGPRLGLGYLLVELAGMANSKRDYVYLSDGGHFENLGIYELIRRRCRYIVACDGGQDGGFTFDDLGNAIRKCRADFGVEIEIDLNSILPKAAGSSGGRAVSGAHCAVGSIKYPNSRFVGTLIYIKASVTGDEPADVLEYAALHPEFPHQTTADQFFDESQFESYRKLGYHLGASVFTEAARRRLEPTEQESGSLDRFFADLRQLWRASSPSTAASFTRHADALANLMRRQREDPDLDFLDSQMTPEWGRMMSGAVDAKKPQHADPLGLPPTMAQRRAGFHFCNAIMQLMEDVYLDLNLQTEHAHPDNAGWMNLFDHWSWSSMFRLTWMISASCYGARFRSFCEHRLRLAPSSIGKIRIVSTDSIEDDHLNYRERDLLSDGAFKWPNDKLYRLEIVVQRPDLPNADMTELTVGVAVVSEAERLVYFRIQEHLRTMGLAGRMLDEMVMNQKLLVDAVPEWRDFSKMAEHVTPENQERVERMLDSALFRRSPNNGRGAAAG